MDDRPDRLSDPETWLDLHGDALYRYALMRVREPALAEDLVQDTLLSAFRARGQFSGQSSERTWLVAILKNKIIDHFRRSSREGELPESDDPDALVDALFKQSNDHWLNIPAGWSDPDTSLENTRFWQAFALCLEGLPERQARAFSLSELEGVESAELCKVLGVTSSNLWVLLHRARLRLQACLEREWFGAEPESE
jgi:RNA polymerase sigma-70 factor (ECF subfamily)